MEGFGGSRPDDGAHNLDGGAAWGLPSTIYTLFVCFYSAILVGILFLLWMCRHDQAIRIRGGFLTIMPVIIVIHIYLAALFVVYPLNGEFKCNTEFWFMSIIFPLGIALFQASNVRFMSVAKIQRDVLELRCWTGTRQPFSCRPRQFRLWFRQSSYLKRTYACIVAGLVVQLVLTIILFVGSRRFKPDSGFFGVHTDPFHCRRGGEWIPSVVWQFLWAWVIGPCVLFRTRHVHDTYRWTWQTRIAVISGLPGTPLWLTFLYSSGPTFESVNRYFPPAMWFFPGLVVMQTSILAFTMYAVFRPMAKDFERPSTAASSNSATSATSSTNVSLVSVDPEKCKALARSFPAFERQLKVKVTPLFHFAATRDFTGENIRFLMDVASFKSKWEVPIRRARDSMFPATQIAPKQMRVMFEDAASIYFELICPTTSEAYINVDSKIHQNLAQIFKSVCYVPPNTPSSSIHELPRFGLTTPWSFVPRETIAHVDSWEMTPITPSADAIPEAVLTTDVRSHAADRLRPRTPSPTALPTMPEPSKSKITPVHNGVDNAFAPSDFPGITVFDEAETSIKYLVYTNTWKTFVMQSDEESLNTGMASPVVAASTEALPTESTSANTDDEPTTGAINENTLHEEMLHHNTPGVPLHNADGSCLCCARRGDARLVKAHPMSIFWEPTD